ncbi:MAG: PAS domain-containing protein [Spirochaetales bacterium]|nr:PAS domain-containing protein [Spirochaetales bacterium]
MSGPQHGDRARVSSSEPATHFAPPHRVSLAKAREQSMAVGRDLGLRRLASSLPDLLAVLNPERQVVFANEQLLRLLGDRSLDSVCGERPGELLGCIHAGEGPAGCGTSRSCRHCGAARAILETQSTGKPSSEECMLRGGQGAAARAYTFQVTTSPLEIGRDNYVLVCFRDIAAEKHRQALQRVFFHDLLNTVSGLKVHLDLLKRQAEGESCRAAVGRLERIAEQLAEEIRSQRLMVQAEAHTLEVQKDLLSSRDLGEELVEAFGAAERPGSAALELAPFYESISFISDEAILRRVLTNLIKNALEASEAGQTVTLGCRNQEGGLAFQVHNPGHMRPAAQEQVFQRFFTTKGPGRGLGTYGVKLLTEGYLDGRVSFESSPERGTTFTVQLPRGGL